MERQTIDFENVGSIVLSQRVLFEFIAVLRKGDAHRKVKPCPNSWLQEPLNSEHDWDSLRERINEVVNNFEGSLKIRYSKLNVGITSLKRWFISGYAGIKATETICKTIAEFIGVSMDQFWEYQSDADDWSTIAIKHNAKQELTKNITIGDSISQVSSEPLIEFFEIHPTLNNQSFGKRYYEDDYYETLCAWATTKNRCLVIADMGKGKTTLISRVGKKLVEGGKDVRYISLSESQFTDSKAIFRELQLLDALGSILFVDDCHDNPVLASEWLARSKQFSNLSMVLATRPLPGSCSYHSLTYTKYITDFSDDSVLILEVKPSRIENIVGKYIEAYSRPDATIGNATKIKSKCAENLKLLEIYLETWREDNFQGLLDMISSEKVYEHLLEEYQLNPEKNVHTESILKVAALSQFDLNCYRIGEYINQGLTEYVTRGRIKLGRIDFVKKRFEYYRLPHAAIGRYLLDAAYYSVHIPNSVDHLEYERNLLLDYFDTVTQDVRNAIPQISIDVLGLFSRIQNDERKDLAKLLLVSNQFQQVYSRLLDIINLSHAIDRKEVLPTLFEFLSILKGFGSETYGFYSQRLYTKLRIEGIIVPDINEGRVEVDLFLNLLKHYSGDDRSVNAIITKTNWEIFGTQGGYGVPNTVKVVRRLKDELREIRMPKSTMYTYMNRFIGGFGFFQMGVEDRPKSQTRLAYNIKGLLDAFMTEPLHDYLHGHGFKLLGQKVCELIEARRESPSSHLPVLYFFFTHIETVMNGKDIEEFMEGFTWETLNYYILNHISFDVVAIIETMLLKRYTYEELELHGVDLPTARFQSLLNHPISQVRRRSAKDRDSNRQVDLLETLKPKFLSQNGVKNQFYHISSMTDMNVFIANAYDIGLPIYQKLIHQEFCEEFDTSLEKWLKPATLQETGIYLSYFAKGSNKRIPWKLPRRMGLDQINVDDKIRAASVIDFVYFEIHLINYLDENDSRIYYEDARNYLKRHYDISKPEELLDKLKNEKLGTISFFLSPAYRLEPDETEQLLKHEGFNDFVAQLFEREEVVEVKDVLGLAGMYMLYDLHVPFSIPRSVNTYSIDAYKDKKVDQIINNKGMVSPRIITAMNRLHPAGLANKYLKHAEEVIQTNLFSDEWKSLFVEQIYAQTKMDLEEA